MEKRYLIYAKSPIAPQFNLLPYIVTNEEFRQFTHYAFDLEHNLLVDPIFLRFCRVAGEVVVVKEIVKGTEGEEIVQTVVTEKGTVLVGYSKARISLLYVRYENVFLRGFKIAWEDLCLVNAMDYVPLDKSLGNGNIEIPKWNKRRSIKSIKYVHNLVRSYLYQVDAEFDTLDALEQDIKNPKEVDISDLIGSML